MSTPEQPATPALTRKQLRDIRNTGATPIITGEPEPCRRGRPRSTTVSVDSSEPEHDVTSEESEAPADGGRPRTRPSSPRRSRGRQCPSRCTTFPAPTRASTSVSRR